MIRPATTADIPAIASLIRALAEYEHLTHQVDLDEANLREHLFGEKPFAEVLIAVDESLANMVVGFALFFHNYSTFRGKPGIYLEDLFVRPESRGRGHGKALLVAVAKLAVQRDCARLEWAVLDWNSPSIEFYKKLGAAPLDDWTMYRLTDETLKKVAAIESAASQKQRWKRPDSAARILSVGTRRFVLHPNFPGVAVNRSSKACASRAMFESLEQRLALSATVTAISADNRGEVLVTFDRADWTNINGATLNKNSVQAYEAGADGHLGTADDLRVAASIRYTSSNGRLLVRGPVAAGVGYRIKVVSSRVTTANGQTFDGNFNSDGTSGDGVAGGNLEFQVKNDKSSKPTARFSTSAGTLNVILRADAAPKNVSNFLSYANSGEYDNIFFTRVASGFVLQGGGLDITSSNTVSTTPDGSPVVGEGGISNTRGTLSLALSSGPNSGTNEFFFNLVNNDGTGATPNLNDTTDGGPFTVFAQAKGASDLAVMDAIAGKATINFSTLNPPQSFSGTDTSSVPVNDASTAQAGLNPARDLIVIRRVAVTSKIAAL